jgi:hypothetical protein
LGRAFHFELGGKHAAFQQDELAARPGFLGFLVAGQLRDRDRSRAGDGSRGLVPERIRAFVPVDAQFLAARSRFRYL